MLLYDSFVIIYQGRRSSFQEFTLPNNTVSIEIRMHIYSYPHEKPAMMLSRLGNKSVALWGPQLNTRLYHLVRRWQCPVTRQRINWKKPSVYLSGHRFFRARQSRTAGSVPLTGGECNAYDEVTEETHALLPNWDRPQCRSHVCSFWKFQFLQRHCHRWTNRTIFGKVTIRRDSCSRLHTGNIGKLWVQYSQMFILFWRPPRITMQAGVAEY